MTREIREWAQQLPVGELFDFDDVQRALPEISRDAIKASLSRLCKGDDPLIARACRGIYTRRLVGGRYKTRLPINARRSLPWRLAGPGAGVTGPYVINTFGWSTQVSPRLWVAMLGRPPQRNDFGTIFQRRFNARRLELNRWEVSILEAVRCFNDWAELSWDDASTKFADYLQRGYYGNEIRGGLIIDAAENERGLGPDFVPRVESLVSAARQANGLDDAPGKSPRLAVNATATTRRKTTPSTVANTPQRS
ncbi:MAG: hypothetical protein KTU85_12440 [Acidimicrobiia bacterium]|nr:hypothetical protein [Acidimicrobiia bacterium]MCY4456536.1 hypothetical protein [Acidimicrobiaceae bacterium]